MYNLNAFQFWCQKVLPLVYDESLSYYEVLGKLTDYINKVISNEIEMDEIVKGQGVSIGELQTVAKELVEEMEKIKNGDYVSLYLDSLINYIDNNLQALVGRIVKYVVFGLSDDGRFIAMIPNSWDFMKFDTIVDTNSELYGHLVMTW